MVDIIRLNKVCVFKNNTPVPVGAGFEDAYSTTATVWGFIKRKGGGRNLLVGEISNSEIYELWIRFDSSLIADINAATKVEIENKEYTIESYENVEDRNFYFKIILNGKNG